jgi:serine/threonine protein kinase
MDEGWVVGADAAGSPGAGPVTLSPERWTEVTPSQFRWEQEALQWLRDHLPDEDPWRVWTNCEFMAQSGAIYEIDALILSPTGLWVVEIKSHQGKLTSEDGLWVFEHEGRRKAIDNPIYLTNRKAKALVGVLKSQTGMKSHSVPWIEALVFCAGRPLEFGLAAHEVAHVVLPDDKAAVTKARVSGIVSAMTSGQVLGIDRRPQSTIDRRQARVIALAIDQVMRSKTARAQVGDYRLEKLLAEGPGWQDWHGVHTSIKSLQRRIRWYMVRDQADPVEAERLRRAADREASILQNLRDPAILPFCDSISTDRGPAHTFDWIENAQPLDTWLASREQQLDVFRAFDLLEQITSAVRSAHSHHLVHRSLSPQSILVVPHPLQEDGQPSIRLINWQTALALAGERRTTGTIHVEELLDSPAAAYCAPEALKDPANADGRADVFSIGCLAWRLFSGRPPGVNHLDVDAMLTQYGALKLSVAKDGMPESIGRLIENATRADLRHRNFIEDVVEDLQEVMKELVAEKADRLALDPTNAHAGDQLRDDDTKEIYEIEKRLGSGASAVAYRVSAAHGKSVVLKIARSAEHDATLRSEFEVLKDLRDSKIVRVHRRTTIGGHETIVMDDAGESMAGRIRSSGFLHYDMLQRLGEDLLHAVDFLETKGVFHRDIKPDNMGITEDRGTRRQTLVLFDFSLAATPLTKLAVGTRHYLDPFLPSRNPPVYDPQAERYAAAVTLFEMATARLPVWGDGVTDPRHDAEATLHLYEERFPANIRDQLRGFFQKAMNRSPKARFDNAREMARAWSQIFQDAEQSSSSSSLTVLSEDDVTLDSPISALGMTPASVNVLDRLGVTTVRGLIQFRIYELGGTRGVTFKTRTEIGQAKHRWSQKFPGLKEVDGKPLPGAGTTMLSTGVDDARGDASIDHCLEQLLVSTEEDRRHTSYKEALLGLGTTAVEAIAVWPSQKAVSLQFSVSQQAVNQAWGKICTRWKTRSGTVKALRDAIHDILRLQGWVMSVTDLADALLAQRGCRESAIPERRKRALACIKAAIDVEDDTLEPRYVAVRGKYTVIIASEQPLAAWADALGEVAEGLMADNVPASPARALELLKAIPAPMRDDEPIYLDDRRLLGLAASASATACLAPNRLELYPRGMTAVWALRLSSGAFVGLDRISERDLQARTLDRYPHADLLPSRPALDTVIKEAGLDLVWRHDLPPDPTMPHQLGTYARPAPATSTQSGGFSIFSTSRGHAGLPSRPVDQVESDAVQARLESHRKHRGFLVMQVEPKFGMVAQDMLQVSFPDLYVLDVDAEVLGEMRAIASGVTPPINWDTVLKADTATPGTAPANQLRRLVKNAMTRLLERWLAIRKPVLVVNPGMFARYDQMTTLMSLQSQAGTASGPPVVWMLLPAEAVGSFPTIEGVAVPIIGAHQSMVLHHHWLARRRPTAQAN